MISALIQGYSPVIPLYLLIILLAVSIIIAWWTYQYLNSVPAWKKRTLISLRAGSLFILVLLLINPFFTTEVVETEKPVISVYLDDSQSIDITRGEYQGLDTYDSLLEQFKGELDDDYDYRFYLFSEEVKEGDELTGTGPITNIHRVVDHISQFERETVASVLFSDGIYTQGRNPIFSAHSLSNPVFTVPIGDTTDVQDVLISDLEFNRVSYTNTVETIRVEVQQEGYPDETATVQLLEDGSLIESKEISFTEESSSHLVEFELLFEEEGFYEYEVNIPELPGEFTAENNRSVFSIEVLDEKTKILSVAFEVHPDVAAMRRVIAVDQQNELLKSLSLGNGRFSGVNPFELDEDPELIILHGLPQPGSQFYEWLNDNNSIPIVLQVTPKSFRQIASYNYGTNLGFHSLQSLRSILDVHLMTAAERYSHPLLEFESVDFRRFPTLKTAEGSYNLSPLSEKLLKAEYQRTETDIPILMTESDNIRRITTINAFGWYRFEQSSSDNVSEFFDQLFTRIISWTATSPGQQNLTLETVKPAFTENEQVVIRANLLNEINEPETDATIEVAIREVNQEDEQIFRMRHTGNGNYEVIPGSFPEGFYAAEATAVKGDRNIGTDETRFNVTRSSVELVNTKRDDALLMQLAERTGGQFLEDGSPETMFEQLNEMDKNQIVENRIVTTHFLSDLPFWFGLVILLLASEWILRRTASLP